jgi:predicted CXXCH cytochrome family protein
MDWGDISYIIGGYGWKARFMDREGYILTGKQNRQFNLANKNLGLVAGWSGYDPKKAPRKPYTCGSCHTTGWTKTGPDGPHQDGLKGIYGTWQEPGVTCEACHGPAAAHTANPAKAKLNTKPNCQTCHIRGDVEKIDASGGLVKHHEQYEDLLASPHRMSGCLACHDPHKGSKYGLGGYKGQQTTCSKCHADQAQAVFLASAHRECISCHMPFAGKSAIATTIAFKGGTVPKGDIRSHIFRIETAPDWNMFTDDGKFVRVDKKGHAYLSLDRVCLGCHVTKDKKWATNNAKRIHGNR